MHVKWEKSSRKKELNGTCVNLDALLVEKYQENGATKQRVVAHLGTIGEKYLWTRVRNMREFHQGLFWVGVDQKLDQLNLNGDRRDTIEALISEMVPRPDSDWALWSVTCIPQFDPPGSHK